HCWLSRTLDVRLELVAELLNAAHNGGRTGVAKYADGLAGHVIREIKQQLEVLLLALPGQNPFQDSDRPGRPLPALGALGAGFVGIEASQAPDLIDHV